MLASRGKRVSDRLKELSIEYELLGGGGRPEQTCEWCGEHSDRVTSVPRQTMYHWDGNGEDPNRNHLLCFDCGIEASEQIEYQWDEYYSSIGWTFGK